MGRCKARRCGTKTGIVRSAPAMVPSAAVMVGSNARLFQSKPELVASKASRIGSKACLVGEQTGRFRSNARLLRSVQLLFRAAARPFQSDQGIVGSVPSPLQSVPHLDRGTERLLRRKKGTGGSKKVRFPSRRARLRSEEPEFRPKKAGVRSNHVGFRSNEAALRSNGAAFRSNEAGFGSRACRSRLAEPGCLEIASDLFGFTPRQRATVSRAGLAPEGHLVSLTDGTVRVANFRQTIFGSTYDFLRRLHAAPRSREIAHGPETMRRKGIMSGNRPSFAMRRR